MVAAHSSGAVVQVQNLRDFFRTSIDDAIDRQGVRVQPPTVQYVVNLLTLYSRSEALYAHDRDSYGIKPLALMLADAADTASPEARNQLLQRIGDVALFISGFFSDGLADAAVDVDYYIHMGGNAYGSLSTEMRGSLRADALSPIYGELAQQFTALVDVLNEVRDGSALSHADLARVYDVWRKTGSSRALAQLRECGIEPLLPGRSPRPH